MKNKIQTLDAISYDEITSLDSRINFCIVENPDDQTNKYYVKIWFTYKMNNTNKTYDGRQEFIAETKEKILYEIKYFMNSDKIEWCIL
jgi:hypothetical protein